MVGAPEMSRTGFCVAVDALTGAMGAGMQPALRITWSKPAPAANIVAGLPAKPQSSAPPERAAVLQTL